MGVAGTVRAPPLARCFLQVSRLEAQLLLERHPECGNLLLRPGGAGGVSVSTRQTLGGTPVVKHFKVKRQGPQYIIDMEEPFSCTSLDAVVNYFVSRTNRTLVPFVLDESYEKVLGYMEADKENGERVWVASGAPGSGPSQPAGGPKKPPPPSIPVPSRAKPPLPLPPRPSQEDHYLTPTDETPAADYVNQQVSASTHPAFPKPQQRGERPGQPPKPPTAPKPVLHGGGLARKAAAWSAPTASLVPASITGLGYVTAELEEKLRKRRALEN